jgi:glyoxylase-like metal-dependent hydrolase (beta-lactamase superfamily II)
MKTISKIFAHLILAMIIVGCRQTKEYQVFALRYCDEGKVQAKDWIIGADQDDSVFVSFYYWLVKYPGGRNILVDAGFIDSAHTTVNYVRPDSILRQLNISPNEISDIIITHPHHDHIGGIGLYPNAMIWMNREDYEYFIGPAWQPGGDARGLNKLDALNIKSVNDAGRLKLLSGDNIEIMPGIKAFTGSKHTFQNMYLLINSNSKKNKILLASDAVWFYMNLEKELPVSVCFDSTSYINSIRRMKSLVSDPNLIIPGHDNRLISKFPYLNDRVIKIAENK